MSPARRTPPLARLAAVGIVLAALAGCAEGGGEFTVTITAGPASCELSRTRIPAGRTNFVVRNEATLPVTVSITKPEGASRADIPAVAPGDTSATLAGLVGGDYTVACAQQGGATPTAPLLVTGDRNEEPPVEQTVAVTATEYRLDGLDAFRARAGERVAFALANAGTQPHALRITGPDGALVGELPPVPPGSAATLAVTLPRNGTYTVVCPIADHSERGMRATFVVGR